MLFKKSVTNPGLATLIQLAGLHEVTSQLTFPQQVSLVLARQQKNIPDMFEEVSYLDVPGSQ